MDDIGDKGELESESIMRKFGNADFSTKMALFLKCQRAWIGIRV